MSEHKNAMELQTETMLELMEEGNKKVCIGLVGNYADTDETRFLLTPEACGLLTSAGINLSMENGAGVDISFPDEKYAEFGVKIVTRDEALKNDIVLSYGPLKAKDIKKMKKGAALLCMMDSTLFDNSVISALMSHGITLGCFDNMLSHNDEPVFAKIIDEINGRAAIMYAQDALSYLGNGKGVLLAGIAGVNPCEILIIGEGHQVHAAAKAGISAGAYVTVMNNDTSALMHTAEVCGPLVNTIAIHPKVLYNKVKTADVIIMGTCTRSFEFPKKLSVAMKDSVYILNLEESHPSVTVPRTVAMALSNVLINFFDELAIKDGLDGMIATTPGVQCGMVTYKGKLVDKLVGSYLGLPCVDINVMLAGSAN